MRSRLIYFVVFLMIVYSAKSQYYYKDILLSRQTQETWKSLHSQKVHAVQIQSMDASDEPTPGFTCTQTISSDFSTIITFTKSANIAASTLLANYDTGGRLIKTTDTSDSFRATTQYTYNENNQIVSLLNISLETDNHISASEKHLWIYVDGKPSQMIKIKGGTDSTRVTFVLDEKGAVIEEKPVHGQQILPSVFYYYDSEGRLTDIVRYNLKAARLLPDYVFEYKYDRISSMLFVPSGSTDYQKWIYMYNPTGLKSTEICYDKKRQPIVKINYNYSFQ